MPDYTDHKVAISLLERSYEAEYDFREKAREAHLFIDSKDGQWDPYWFDQWKRVNRPRMSFDLVTPLVDQIAGEMKQADFNIQVRPSGGDATKDIAQTYDGLIRNIETISNASTIYNAAGRNMLICGLDGWGVRSKYVEEDSFNQDLVIEPIYNFIDSVWFDDNSLTPDNSDSQWGFWAHVLTPDAYNEQFGEFRPDGPPVASSIPESRQLNAFWYKASDQIVTAEFYYAKHEEKEIVLMTNGTTLEVNEDFQRVEDELKAANVTIKRRRTVKVPRFYVRKMDGTGWLGEEEKTVFRQIPLIPTYGNHKIFENKVLYRGVVEKQMDPQRTLNYSKSREIEEGALAPRAKYFMTNEQTKGHEDSLERMNVSAQAVQIYNNDPEVPGPPQQQGGAQINPALNDLSNSMVTMIQTQSGMFDANMGNSPNAQSGVAIEKLQNKGDASTSHYWGAQEIAICQTAKLLIDAIPEVYDAQRQVRILKEDGAFEMTMLHEPSRDGHTGEYVLDEQTGKPVILNDLSVGKYDVTCSAGPGYQNRQDQSLASMIEVGTLLPESLSAGADLLFAAMDGPAAELMRERMRLPLLESGAIPPEQMTKEEQAQAEEASQQEPAPDPMMVAAQAEQGKADAAMATAQLKGQQVEIEGQKLALKSQEIEFKAMGDAQKLELEQMSLQLTAQQQDRDTQIAEFTAMQDSIRQDVELIHKSAETLKTLREAMGVDGVMSPEIARTLIEQAHIVSDQQQEI